MRPFPATHIRLVHSIPCKHCNCFYIVRTSKFLNTDMLFKNSDLKSKLFCHSLDTDY